MGVDEKRALEAKALEAKALEAKAPEAKPSEAEETKREDVDIDALVESRFLPAEVKKDDVVTDATVDGTNDVLGRPNGIYADVENAKLQEAQNAAREGRKPRDEYIPYHGSPRAVQDAYADAASNG